MAFTDAGDIERGTVIEADVCIAGAGPAGLAVALDLADAGLRVLLLESGGSSPEAATAELDAVDATGIPASAAGPQRDRRFGGTVWYGRSVALDPIDFEARSWVPLSGWPIPRAEVESRYPRAARFLGLSRPDALSMDFWRHEPLSAVMSGGGLAPRVHLITHASDTGQRHRAAVARASTLTALLHATVVGIDVDSASRSVSRLRIAGPGGQELSARARRYVLACGGIENARLLLLLAADLPGVLGASSAMLGRCYMNHTRCDGVARLRLNRAHPASTLLFRRLIEGYSSRSRSRVQIAVGIDEELQRREELLNACAFFYASSEPRLAGLRVTLDQLRRSAAERTFGTAELMWVGRLAGGLPLLLRAGVARALQKPFMLDSLVMVEQLEEAPDRGSVLTLGGGCDRFGRRRIRLEPRIGSNTLRTQRRFHELLADRFRAQGVGTFESAILADPGYAPAYGDAAHPMGATRMSDDPTDGVVNPDGRVHALDNLYVAGSSVFPTGGHANPTLALTALAFRLSDQLRLDR